MDESSIAEFKRLMQQVQALMNRMDQPTFPPDALDESHRATLHQLHTLCEQCSEEDPEGPPRSKKKRKKPVRAAIGGPSDPWKRITNLDQLPVLADYIRAHFDKYRESPESAEKFLRTHGLDSECGRHASGEQTGDAFMARYNWTQRVDRRMQQVRVLQLFNELFWYDLVQIVRPKGSGRVGVKMQEALDALLEPVEAVEAGLDKKAAKDNIGEWSLRGGKVNKLCKKFGTGVILILHDKLSRDFLDNKFTATGDFYEAAMARLSILGLEDRVRGTGAGDLADAIRELMIKPFRDAYDDQRMVF